MIENIKRIGWSGTNERSIIIRREEKDRIVREMSKKYSNKQQKKAQSMLYFH